MPNPPITDERLSEIVDAYRQNSLNVSATARAEGKARTTIQKHLHTAEARGLLSEAELHNAETPNRDAYLTARATKAQRYQAKQRKGSWDKPVMVQIPEGPFRLKLFGDPHLDADGCDFDLFERHWQQMDPTERVYGVCIGDWFNNWLRVLSHLWRGEGDPSDAWTLFEYLMEQNGAGLIGACSGNHDDWTHGPVDPVDLMMKRHGVVYRKGAVRLVLKAGETPITIALRHKWKGHSQFAPSHGLKKAAMNGWHDHIMVGGHTHVDEDRQHIVPRSGFVAHLFQVSSFKRFDDFADVHGFMPHSHTPVRDLVIQPGKADSDPDKVKAFYSDEDAKRFFDSVRAA